MFAAVSPRSDRGLDTVKLVLRLEANDQVYPARLKEYFHTVVQQAIDLLARPNEVASNALPEAVSLAVKLSCDADFQMLLKTILEETEITNDQAEKALSSLETSFDPVSESAHFSREIYAAI